MSVLREAGPLFREEDLAHSRAASAYLSAAFEAELTRRGYAPLALADPSPAELETIGAHRRLLRQLSASSSIRAVEHGTHRSVRIQPELRLGPGLAALATRAGCERALLVFGGAVEESAGRRADSVLAVPLNFTLVLASGIGPASGTALCAAWIDLPSGDVQWLGALEELGGTFSAAPSPSDRDDAREMVARLLEGLAPSTAEKEH